MSAIAERVVARFAAASRMQGPAVGGQPFQWRGGLLRPNRDTAGIDPATHQRGHWLTLDVDGHSTFGITGTQYLGPDTGNIYQIEVTYVGNMDVGFRRPQYWFMGRKPNGGILGGGISKKFSSYDAAFRHWGERFDAAKTRLDPQQELQF